MRFYALDVETANHDHSSICQIGIGVFEDHNLVDTWKSYIDPETSFNWYNIKVHGITNDLVCGAPKIVDVYSFLKSQLDNNIVVHHTSYDRIAFEKVYRKYNLEPLNILWLDSSMVARRTWKEFSTSGYNLANIASLLGIEFQHHDALEDAITAGKIVIEASKKSNLRLEEWIKLF